MNERTEPTMNEGQIVALVACMLSVAHVDGLRPEEDALIRDFYAQSWVEGMPQFEALPSDGANALALLAGLPQSVEFADQVVMLTAMTGYCDGDFSAAERQHVEQLGAAAGVDAHRIDELVRTVKDSLIRSIAHLPDSVGVASVAKSL